MRTDRPVLRRASLAVLALSLAAGCSLVNSLDELRPADDGKLTGETRPTPTVIYDDAGLGPSGSLEAGAEAGAGEEMSPIVVGAESTVGDAGALQPFLTVIDAKTGRERGQREPMWVAGIVHDPSADLWYIFEGPSHFVVAPTEKVKIHLRRLDLKTGAWTELSSFEGSPLVYYDGLAVTRQRLSYIAHPATGSTRYRLVTINASDVSAMSLNSELELGTSPPRGMTGTPTGTGGPGGFVSLINVDPRPQCTAVEGGTSCQVKIQRYQIPSGGVTAPIGGATAVGAMNANGQPGYGSVTCGAGPDDVVVLPGVGTGAGGGVTANGVQTVKTLDHSSSSETGSRTFTMRTGEGEPSLLRKLGVDNSRRVVFVVEANNDRYLYAVPLNGGAAAEISIRHSGQTVYYDHASQTAFAPFNQGNSQNFSPFRVSGGRDGVPLTLAERLPSTSPGGDWDPPADLRPNLLGIRQSALACP